MFFSHCYFSDAFIVFLASGANVKFVSSEKFTVTNATSGFWLINFRIPGFYNTENWFFNAAGFYFHNDDFFLSCILKLAKRKKWGLFLLLQMGKQYQSKEKNIECAIDKN